MSGPSLTEVLRLFRSQLFFHPPVPKSDFSRQTVIVTGGNAGLGLQTAKEIARLGAAKLIIACRTVSKGEDAKKHIQEETGCKTDIEVMALDLSSFESVRAFAKRANELDRLDALLENAGTWPTKFEVAEKHEVTITVNVISTLLLARLLLPKLQETAKEHHVRPRLTIVSSQLGNFATFKARKSDNIFGALKQETTDFDGRYQDSKLLEMMCVRKLAAEMSKSGNSTICISSVNPGYCMSGLKPADNFAGRMFERLMARSTDQGGRILVDSVAADKPVERHGSYLSDTQVRPTPWLDTKDGKATVDRVWSELNTILEGISPGCTSLV